MYTLEELKTYVGLMMLDLRGNWGFDYQYRIELTNDFLTAIIEHEDSSEEDKSDAQEDIEIGLHEIESGDYDGRVYRDCANFYGYKSEEGLTQKIHNMLMMDMTYPEYNLPEMN